MNECRTIFVWRKRRREKLLSLDVINVYDVDTLHLDMVQQFNNLRNECGPYLEIPYKINSKDNDNNMSCFLSLTLSPKNILFLFLNMYC